MEIMKIMKIMEMMEFMETRTSEMYRPVQIVIEIF